MERFNKLSSVLRYVGLNLNPAILEVVITLDEKIAKGNLTIDQVDAVVAAIDAKTAPADAPSEAPCGVETKAPAKAKKLVKA
jgi:hypothetical protein